MGVSLKDDTQESSASLSGALAYLGVFQNSSLCKDKGILDLHLEEIVPAWPSIPII